MFAALCDDDKYIIEELKKLLLTYAKKRTLVRFAPKCAAAA